ncbi:Membrane-bound lytic murein transglycosylase D precursor [compost metagenome]
MRINLLKPKVKLQAKPVPSLKRKAAKMGGLLLGVNLALILVTADMGDSSLHPANLLGTSSESTQEVKLLAPNKDLILSDYKDLIGEDFHIPEGLKDRVGFWFDVYTKYDNNNRIIHHSLYPWIVFKVVDVTEIINAEEPRVRWLRNVKADKFVASEMAAFRKALTHLSRGKAVDTSNEYQVAVEKSLSLLPGTLKQNARKALREVRVQTGQRNFFAEGLEVSPLYLKGMEEIFRNNKLPVELTRLPFVESSFNKHAKSKVGASGLWQFMDSTGRKFMIVQEHIDERTSPFKATEAAARLLKENHMILKRSWPLALTAWNHGPSGLRRAMKKAGSHDLTDIISKGRSANFDFASSNFYSEFLAALFAERYHDEMFENLDYEKELDLHTVKLARSVGAKELLRLSGLTKEDFLLFNPDLKRAVDRNASVPRGFTLMLDDGARTVLKNLLSKESLRTSAVKEKLSEADIVAL